MLKRLRAILLATMLALPIGVITAPTVLAACAPGVPGVQLYEYNNLSGDSRLFCGSVSDLRNYTHTQPGFCEGEWKNLWDNCANSFRVWMNSSTCLRFYNSPNYGLHFETINGPQTGSGFQFGFLDQNIASSFRFVSC